MNNFFDVMLTHPAHPLKIAITIVCVFMSIIVFVQYKKDKDRRKLGHIGAFLTLIVGFFIGLLYPKVLSRKIMAIIQTIIPIVAILFIIKFRRKPKVKEQFR